MFSQTIRKSLPYNVLVPTAMKQIRYYSCQKDSGLCLRDKVVLITGAGSGIGASAAIAYAKEGSKLVMVDKDLDNLKRVEEHCTSKYCAEAMSIKVDVSQDPEVECMVCQALKRFRTIDVLINNAGILVFGSILKGDLMESYDKVMSINLRACLYITTLVAPSLVQNKGNVVNISSIMGRTYVGDYKYLPYCISKAGLDHFMRGAALELGCYGIRVNNVCPGPTKTDIFSRAGVKGSWKEIGESFRIDNVSDPEEIADLIVYLSSDKAKSITGVTYYIDKGTLLMG